MLLPAIREKRSVAQSASREKKIAETFNVRHYGVQKMIERIEPIKRKIREIKIPDIDLPGKRGMSRKKASEDGVRRTVRKARELAERPLPRLKLPSLELPIARIAGRGGGGPAARGKTRAQRAKKEKNTGKFGRLYRAYRDKDMDHARREGDCKRCGACCKLPVRCPFYINKKCSIYERRFKPCRVYPARKSDLVGVNCGYRFVK